MHAVETLAIDEDWAWLFDFSKLNLILLVLLIKKNLEFDFYFCLRHMDA